VHERLIARVLVAARVRAIQQPVAERAARVGGVQDLERRLARVGGKGGGEIVALERLGVIGARSGVGASGARIGPAVAAPVTTLRPPAIAPARPGATRLGVDRTRTVLGARLAVVALDRRTRDVFPALGSALRPALRPASGRRPAPAAIGIAAAPLPAAA